ncbi:MAG: MBL fold metallo-hydrolase [Ardenticatenaceae bacterium]
MIREFLVGLLMRSPRIQKRAIKRMAQSRMQKRSQTAQELLRRDAITVVLSGTGTPLPSERAQSSVAIFVNGQFLLFDCGHRAMRSMEVHNLPLGQLNAVFLTHYHSDHFADLGEVINRSWIFGRRHILPVYGPPGVVDVVTGFAKAYHLDNGYRTAHHGEEITPSASAPAKAHEFAYDESGAPVVVYEQDGVIVKAFAVNHFPAKPAVGFRIEYKGKVVVISGDTIVVPPLLEQSKNADLLICDVMNKEIVALMESALRELGNHSNAKIMQDIPDYHMDVHDVGQLAQKNGVKHLALTHLVPTVTAKAQVRAFFEEPVAQHYAGKLTVGEDGTRIVIPLD